MIYSWVDRFSEFLFSCENFHEWNVNKDYYKTRIIKRLIYLFWSFEFGHYFEVDNIVMKLWKKKILLNIKVNFIRVYHIDNIRPDHVKTT